MLSQIDSLKINTATTKTIQTYSYSFKLCSFTGGIYYRDLARIKMKQRELYPDKELEVLKTVKKNRKIKVRRINPHAPRTSTALKKVKTSTGHSHSDGQVV